MLSNLIPMPIKTLKLIIHLIALSQAFTPVLANNFSTSKKTLHRIYSSFDGETFYCGCEVNWKSSAKPVSESCGYTPRNPITKKGKVNLRTQRIEWEHIVPAHRFGHHLSCWKTGGRKSCKKDPSFQQMESDMHNLVPAIGELNGDRSNFSFNIIKGEDRLYGKCDFEINFKTRVVEPSEEIRGDIARVYLYMSERYGVNLNSNEVSLFNHWSNEDPISEYEIFKHNLVSKEQGNTNPFIADISKRSKSISSKSSTVNSHATPSNHLRKKSTFADDF